MKRASMMFMVLLACGCDDSPANDAGAGMDAGVDAGSAEPDAGSTDAGADDAGAADAGASDAGAGDGGAVDGGAVDAGAPDAGAPDAGSVDAGAPDAGAPDAGSLDAGAPDAGPLVCGAPSDFGVGPCAGDSDCIGMACWRETGPLPPGGCLFAGCTTRCAIDAQCQCAAATAGATAPGNASCSASGICDLSGTGLGSPYVCS